jgi:hypothetical protein
MTAPLTLKDSWALAVPFLVCVGACYSFGYWGHFDIDILQFVGLTDIAKLAIYPLLFFAVTTVLTITWTEITLGAALPPGGGAATPIGRVGLKYWRVLVALVLLALAATLLYVPEPRKWYAVSLLASFLAVGLTHVRALIELLPNPRIRAVLLLQLVLLPTLSFAHGRASAFRVESGDAAFYVDAERSGLPLRSDLSAPIVYLGKLGETYVYLEKKTGKLALVKAKDDVPLILRRAGG